MAGVYGEFLGNFAELFETFEVYEQHAQIGTGYQSKKIGTIRAIRQTLGATLTAKTRAMLFDVVGRSNGVLSVENGWLLFSYKPLDVLNKWVKIDNEMYRPLGISTYVKEGGFYRTEVRKVIGLTQETAPKTTIEGQFD